MVEGVPVLFPLCLTNNIVPFFIQPQTKGVRLNLPRWISMEGAEQLGLTTHSASGGKSDKVIDKSDPLYCKVWSIYSL